MTRASRCFVGALLAAGLSACDHAPAPPAQRPGDAQRSIAAPVSDASIVHDAGVPGAAVVANASPSAVFEGHAGGRGVEPPIHEFAPHAGADGWSGNGAVHLEIPSGDGLVSGTIHMTGLVFAVRGRRVNNRITAVLDQMVDATSAPAASEPVTDSGPPEGLFRGAFDGDIHGTALRGTWDASATGGVHRRSGTLEASEAH